jgi:hydrogenase 3 maturation protease
MANDLSTFLQGRVCVLGFGNRMWRDDGVGSCIAEALQDHENLDAVDGGFVPENHLEAVAATNPDTILMIDAADFGGFSGEMRLLKPGDVVLAGVSTHAGSPQMLGKYLEVRTGASVALLAIQPKDSSEGDKLSPEVSAAMADLLAKL